MRKAVHHRVLFTAFLILLFRFATFVHIPGISKEFFRPGSFNGPIFNSLYFFSGNSHTPLGLLTLGVTPYINASILTQLATTVVPALEKLHKEEGEVGKRKLLEFTRSLAVCLAILQSVFFSFWVKSVTPIWAVQSSLELTLTLVTGSMISMWISDQITELGVGNGTSVLIFVNILSTFPNIARHAGPKLINRTFDLLLLVITFLFIIVGVIFVQEGTRRIPILTAKQLGKEFVESSTSYLPLKLTQGGVMPLIFASTFLTFPMYLGQFLHNQSVVYVLKLVSPYTKNKYFYLGFYFVLVLFFSYFYASLAISPTEISKNLNKMESVIPGVRPGHATTNYLQGTLNRLVFLGALFLAILTLVPDVLEHTLGVSTPKRLSITSILILVGVILETSKQLQTGLISEHYEHIID